MRINLKNISFNEYDKNGIIKNSIENYSGTIDIKGITKINFSENYLRFILRIVAEIYKPYDGIIECSYNYPFYIPQEKYSFPWLTTNDYFKQNSKNCSLDETEIIKLVDLDGYENFLPKTKSSGFRLRQILATAVWKGADLIIIDNSFQKLNPADKGNFELVFKNIRDKCSIDFLIFDERDYFRQGIFDEIISL